MHERCVFKPFDFRILSLSPQTSAPAPLHNAKLNVLAQVVSSPARYFLRSSSLCSCDHRPSTNLTERLDLRAGKHAAKFAALKLLCSADLKSSTAVQYCGLHPSSVCEFLANDHTTPAHGCFTRHKAGQFPGPGSTAAKQPISCGSHRSSPRSSDRVKCNTTSCTVPLNFLRYHYRRYLLYYPPR